MIYYLSIFLKPFYSGFNVLQYITFRAGGAVITSLLLSFLFGAKFISILRARKVGQMIREDGPKSHLLKAGTPTMGGLMILLAMLVSSLLWTRLDNRFIQVLIFSTVYLGFLGFYDDYQKLVKKNPKGLSAGKKLLFQTVLGILVAGFVYFYPPNPAFSGRLLIPYLKETYIYLGALYPVFTALVVVGSSNAVNLTDGLDGLAIGGIIFTALAYIVFAYTAGHAVFSSYLKIISVPNAGEITVYLAAMIGAAIGFLWFNSYPASVFMGDTGSLFLGGVIGIIAVLIKQELILLVAGGIFVLEIISVVLQVASFKYRGKRIFKMAPLHHHFELSGWLEPKVVVRFWIISIMLMLLALASLKIR